MVSSLAYISVRELGKAGEPEIRTVFWFSCVTTVLGGVWALTGELHRPDAGGLAILLGIGLFGGLAQLAMTRSYRFGKTVVSAALSYSTVIFASLFGMAIWDETHPPSAWLAIVLIIVSGLMVSFASRRRADD
jgi:drug/metabolite transporter (DMT)-like permease